MDWTALAGAGYFLGTGALIWMTIGATRGRRSRKAKHQRKADLMRYAYPAGWVQAIPTADYDLIKTSKSDVDFLTRHWQMTYEVPGGVDGIITPVLRLDDPDSQPAEIIDIPQSAPPPPYLRRSIKAWDELNRLYNDVVGRPPPVVTYGHYVPAAVPYTRPNLTKAKVFLDLAYKEYRRTPSSYLHRRQELEKMIDEVVRLIR